MITIDQFYSLLRDAARSSPPVENAPCLQLQAFRALAFEDATEITAPNFGATVCDRERPYYWSRAWAASGYDETQIQAEFPVLAAFERTGVRKNAFNPQHTTVSEIEIAVIDRYDTEGCESGNCKGCAGRTRMEIFRDTRYLLSYVLNYIGGAVFADIDNIGKGLFHQATLEQLFATNEIGLFSVISDFGATMAGANLETRLFNVEFAAARYWGTGVVINAKTFDCQPLAPVVMLPDTSGIVSKTCCQ